MPLESKLTEEQLFDSLISSLVHSVWVSLGKIKNPMNEKIERNLYAASMNIDMLDMLFKRMEGNLNEQEETYLTRILSELKMNFLEEKKKGDDIPEDKPNEESESSDTKSEPTEKVDDKPSGKKAKKSTAKPKDKK